MGRDPFVSQALQLNGLLAPFVGADAYGLFDGDHEDLSITDLVSVGSLANGLDHFLYLFVGKDHFDFDLGQEVHVVFASTVDLLVTFLPAKAFDLGDGHADDTHFGQGFAHFVHFKGFDNCFDFFHESMG